MWAKQEVYSLTKTSQKNSNPMAKYILCNRDPFNLVRQKCDKDLPGAGDPPVQPGGGKEFVQGKKVISYCTGRNSVAAKYYAYCWGPCGSFAGESTPPGLDPQNQNEAWKKAWKKHNAVWGSLPRNKKRPNILDQNANFVCLQLLQDSWGPECPNPPSPTQGLCPYANCNKPSHRFSMTDRANMIGSNECGYCKKCYGYGLSLGITKKYNIRSLSAFDNLI